jgi:ABC-type Fe3+/spermidine/putrescine transport system ATPase subunit
MRNGQIIQQGSPESVYSTPISPAMAISTGDALVLDASKLADGSTAYLFSQATNSTVVEAGHIVIRPEEIKLDRNLTGAQSVGRISKIDYYGHDAMVTLDCAGQVLKVRIPGPFDYAVGEQVSLEHAGPVRYFSAATPQ